MFNRDGLVIGLANWTERETTHKQVAQWKLQPDYGICIQTRFLRALDVDVKDPIIAGRVMLFLQERYNFPIRFRANSSKFLMAFYLEGVLTKRVCKLNAEQGGPMVEFLANGQQFVACGTHTEGARYEWDWRGLGDFPTLNEEQFEELWAALVAKFGFEVFGGGTLRKSRVAGAVTVADDVAKFIEQSEFFIGVARDGKIMMTCPWITNHSTDNGDTQTMYMPPGDRDYKRGHFKCLHAGCAGKKDADFLDAIGFNDTMFDAVPARRDKEGREMVAREPLNFRRSKAQKRGVDMIISELENLVMALARPDFSGYHLRFDEFLDEMMYAPVLNPNGWQVMDDGGKVHLRLTLERQGFEPKTTFWRAL